MRKLMTLIAVVAVSIFVLPATASAATYAISGFCDSDGTPQICDPATGQVVNVAAPSLLEVQFTTSSGHCSDIKVAISVDGGAAQQSGFLGAGQSTAVFVFGPFATGAHTVSVQATGRVGGCNGGFLGSWVGTLDVTEVPAVPTTLDDCKKGGWTTLVDSEGNAFKNQGDCVSFVATGGSNLGAG